MSSENPYSSPATQSAELVRPASDPLPLATIVRLTFLAWEKLRLLYIAILAVETLLISLLDPSNLLVSIGFWGLIVQGAIIANVCYFAGPIVETYVSWLGLRAPWLRIVLFVLGTISSCALAVAAVASQLLPTMN